MKRSVAIVAVIALALLAAGCAHEARRLDEAGDAGSALQLLDKQPSTDSLKAEHFHLETGDLSFLIIQDDQREESGEGKSIVYRRVKTDQFGATIAIAEGTLRTQFVRTDDDGNIVMTAVIDHKEDVVSLFEPPLVVAYRELKAGQERTSEGKMRVVHAKDQSKERESGKARRTIKYAADQRIRTAAGEFLAKRAEVRFIADLKMAKAQEQSIIFVVPERGIVAERVIEEQKVLGAFGKTTRRTIVRGDLAK